MLLREGGCLVAVEFRKVLGSQLLLFLKSDATVVAMAQLFPDPADSSVESSAKNGQLYGDVVPGEYFQVA